MCSVNDSDASGSELMERRTRDGGWSSICQKCAEAKPVIQILQIKHAYCRNCFLSHVNHKFRSTLGKSKMMRPSDSVMVSFSGSCKSLALLHLMRAGLSERSHKRFLFKVHVLYIDEGAVLGIPVSQREFSLNAVANIVSSLEFSMYFTTLSSIYTESGPKCFSWGEENSLKLNDEAERNLVELFHNTDTLTAKEDLLRQLRKSLMVQAASEIGCTKIFTAETSTDLAIRILTDVALGRGSQLHHDVSFCDDRLATLKFLKPMRELSSKEAAFYSVYNNLNGIQIPSLCTKTELYSSMHRLSEQFVMNLMEEFPSTVSTVFRTGEKLGSGTPSSVSHGFPSEERCLLCQATLDLDLSDCSSIQATSFSRLISSLGPVGFDNLSLKPSSQGLDKEKNPDLKGANASESSSQSNGEIDITALSGMKQSLCYGCCLIFHDMKSSYPLERVLQISHPKVQFEEMRKSIQEFLL